ncbi:MAG: 50S ribosomal protein L4 [Patescibacteria group bacterium]
MQTNLYNQKGETQGTIQLPDNIFNIPWNADLVYQVVVSSASNFRKTIASTKDRAQVSGGGRKPWKQKHTGRARHGSIRSPLWRGGGVSHGPKKEKVFDNKKINKKMLKGALSCVLSEKLREGKLFIVKDFETKDTAKTKTADVLLKEFLKNVKMVSEGKKSKTPKTLILAPTYDKNFGRSIRNLPYAFMDEARNASASRILSFGVVLLSEKGIEPIQSLFSKKNSPEK